MGRRIEVIMTIELFRYPTPKNMDVFDLGWETWRGLQDLAKAFGWIPQGTVLMEPCPPVPDYEAVLEAELAAAREKVERLEAIPDPPEEVRINISFAKGFIENRLDPYGPIYWGFHGMRRVTPDDAIAFAEALDRALRQMRELRVDLPHKGPFYLAEEMNEQLFHRINGGVSRRTLEDFIPFLRRGGFGISEWD